MQLRKIEAVIFDMDGLLADTEPLWRNAMVDQFNKSGISFDEEDCRVTTGMRFMEVVEYWNGVRPFSAASVSDVHDSVLNTLCKLILENNIELPGVIEALDSCRKYKLPIGLATSSPTPVIEAVLKKLDISRYFDTIVSAEKLSFGKPHPEVFLNCAKKLNVESQSCLVLEDSVNGVIAGKAGLMTVVAVPEERNFHDYRYSIADFKIKTLNEFPKILNELKNEVSVSA